MKARSKLIVKSIALLCALLMVIGLFAGCVKPCLHQYEGGKCTVCGESCKHVLGYDKEGVCILCGTPCSHENGYGTDGKCETCGVPCTHGEYGADGKCVVCGTSCTHEEYDEDGLCVVCGTACTHQNGYDKSGKCPVCGAECDHTYSSSTGKCTVCGVECKHKLYDANGKCTTCGMACSKHKYNDQGICQNCGHHKFPDVPEITDASRGLPRINVVTDDGTFEDATSNHVFDMNDPTSKKDWQYEDCLVSVENCDEKYQLLASGGIKVRGNYTTNYPKKPFRIKFDSKQSMLGLNDNAKLKSWVLLADYKDVSMERNSLAFYLSNRILGSDGLYSSDYQQVELYLNGQYWGVYLLAEQQQVNKNRIDVTEPDEKNDPLNPYIGYFLEYDGYYNFEIYNERFYLDYNSFGQLTKYDGSPAWIDNRVGFTIKSDVFENEEYPEYPQAGYQDRYPQKNFIKNYTTMLYEICYKAVYSNQFYTFNDKFTELVSYSATTSNPVYETVSQVIDLQSLVDMYIINEIACDADIAWSSFYLDVDLAPEKDHHVRFEAPWDFDSALGLKTENEGMFAANSNNPWLIIFINQDWFQQMVANKWTAMKNAGMQEGALNLINSLKTDNTAAYQANFDRWGFIVNGESTGWIQQNVKNHAQAVQQLYNWTSDRFTYLNQQYQQWL